jgi:hypothetical protein
MSEHAYIRFPDWGCPWYVQITQLELEILYHGAGDMILEHDDSATDSMIQTTVRQLRRQARDPQRITEEWITTATLIAAMQGLRGHQVPDICRDR